MKSYNLLEEIYSVLDAYELSTKDILWCGSEDFRTVWKQFEEVAKYTDYEKKSELPQDLVIVANGWYLSMICDEMDSELFEVIETPKMPSLIKDIKHLTSKEFYTNLIDIN